MTASFKHSAFLAGAALLAAGFHAAPAAAQGQKEYCVARLPFPPVPPAKQSKLVIYQAYVVPNVGQQDTVFDVHAQMQNQSSGTVNVRVNVANLNAPGGGRWAVGGQTVTLTSYQPKDVVLAKLTVPGKTNTSPVDAWQVVDRLVQSCPFSR